MFIDNYYLSLNEIILKPYLITFLSFSKLKKI